MSECQNGCGCKNNDPNPETGGLRRLAFVFVCAVSGYGLSHLYYSPESLMKEYSITDSDAAEKLQHEKAIMGATSTMIAAMALTYSLRPRT